MPIRGRFMLESLRKQGRLMHRHMQPEEWARAFGDPADPHGGSLFACPDCSIARGDLEAWLVSVETCPRCWPSFQAYAPVSAEVLACESCMATYHEFETRVEKLEHYEPLVVAEWVDAQELADELAALPLEARLALVAAEGRYQRWGLCQRLLETSRSLWFTDPRGAHDWARVAVAVAGHLAEERYDSQWVADLRAKAHGYLANTLRLVGDLAASEREFGVAERWVDRGVGHGRAEAKILSLKASLLLDQYRLLEAEALLDRVKRYLLEYEQRHEAGRILLKLALVSHAREMFAQATKRTEQALALLDAERDPRSLFAAQQNLVRFRIDAGDAVGARAAFEKLPPAEERLLRLRRTCLEADLLRLEGDLDRAARLYDDIRIAYLAEELHYDVALVSLDLAMVATAQGRTDTVRELARDAVVLLTRSGAPQQAFAAVRLLVDSLEREAVSAAFIQQIARKLARLQPAA